MLIVIISAKVSHFLIVLHNVKNSVEDYTECDLSSLNNGYNVNGICYHNLLN